MATPMVRIRRNCLEESPNSKTRPSKVSFLVKGSRQALV